MALSDAALITVEYLQTQAHDTHLPDIDVLEGLINQASAIAETKTGRRLKARDYDQVFDGPIGRRLVLPEYPVNTVTTVWIDRSREWGDDEQITDYVLESGSGVLHRDYLWGGYPQSVRVQYNAGFAEGAVPEDLQEAIVELCLWLMPRQSSGLVGRRSVPGVDGQPVEMEISMPLHATRTLIGHGRPE